MSKPLTEQQLKLYRLADAIEKEHFDNITFNMRHWAHDRYSGPPNVLGRLIGYRNPAYCGTTCCIAGYAIALETGKEEPRQDDMGRMVKGEAFAEAAQRILGLTTEQAHELFMPEAYMFAIGPKMAAQVVRTLAETGEVRWPKEVLLPDDGYVEDDFVDHDSDPY